MAFKFGLETEYLLSHPKTHQVYWYEDLNFHQLHQLFLEVSLEHIPSLVGLDQEPAHAGILPFVVEGYHLKNDQHEAFDMHPKGIEIRSPVCNSIDECLLVQKLLYRRLSAVLEKKNMGLTILSHHPWAFEYNGPQANRPHHFWQWAKRAMLTYGPDLNISWHSDKGKNLFKNKEDFEEKLNFYAPALVALSAFSPFYRGKLAKTAHGETIKSVRTYYRSDVAPLLEWHENENLRLEFKFFDMALSWEEYTMYFDLCLALLLGEELHGRKSLEEGKKDLKIAATTGLKSADLKERALQLIKAGMKALPLYGFKTSGLKLAQKRIHELYCPADFLIQAYEKGMTMDKIVQRLSGHVERETDWITVFGYSLIHGFHAEHLSDHPEL